MKFKVKDYKMKKGLYFSENKASEKRSFIKKHKVKIKKKKQDH